MWTKASPCMASLATQLMLRDLADEVDLDALAQAESQYSIEMPKDPEAGNHNYLNLSGHYGRGNSRSAKSIGHIKRGERKPRLRVRKNI